MLVSGSEKSLSGQSASNRYIIRHSKSNSMSMYYKPSGYQHAQEAKYPNGNKSQNETEPLTKAYTHAENSLSRNVSPSSSSRNISMPRPRAYSKPFDSVLSTPYIVIPEPPLESEDRRTTTFVKHHKSSSMTQQKQEINEESEYQTNRTLSKATSRVFTHGSLQKINSFSNLDNHSLVFSLMKSYYSKPNDYKLWPKIAEAASFFVQKSQMHLFKVVLKSKVIQTAEQLEVFSKFWERVANIKGKVLHLINDRRVDEAALGNKPLPLNSP